MTKTSDDVLHEQTKDLNEEEKEQFVNNILFANVWGTVLEKPPEDIIKMAQNDEEILDILPALKGEDSRALGY